MLGKELKNELIYIPKTKTNRSLDISQSGLKAKN